MSKRKNKGKGPRQPKGSTLIELPWLRAEVLLIHTEKHRRKVGKRLGVGPDDPFLVPGESIGGMASVIYHRNLPWFILYIPKNDRATVIHECTHMVHLMFENRGIPVNTENTETIAYMTEHLCEIVFNIFEGTHNEENR